MDITEIYYSQGDKENLYGLGWEGDRLATKEEFDLADRCVGSIFEALEVGEKIRLAEGVFELGESDFPD